MQTIESPPTNDVLIVDGKKLISRKKLAGMLGMKEQSLSTSLSRGATVLTRYYLGRAPHFDLAEVERLILSKAVPPGQRKRMR